ncbi:winged helix-turn-helix transcriptional regulator [Pikeienuella piscinae]|uniref:Winged helix-turn-helix transcriptional regulator n=1 Tax=Pikeienuella piscinae TaxID=2748098 RepID=A0A7L5BX05_9RHOB|nr:MarR family winged helix-turn-helix transcriptional regulator [Pikeienuella piscinae]QIE56920.1 winged helix-turn-helix transcriptional regulator [Pikeienuella piscinae]
MASRRRSDISSETTKAVLAHWRDSAPDDRPAHLLRHVSRGLRRALEFRLAKHSISFGHWTFLRILWLEDGLSQRELSIRAGVMEPTTHTAIAKMATLGLVERRQAQPGRKRSHIYLTPHGRALEAELVPLAEEANNVALAGAAEEDVARLRAILLLMVKNLAADEIRALDSGQRILPTRRRAGRT